MSNSPKLLFLLPKYIQMKEHTDITGQGHFTSHPHGWDLNLDVRLDSLGQGKSNSKVRKENELCIGPPHSMNHIFAMFQLPGHQFFLIRTSSPLTSHTFFLSPLLLFPTNKTLPPPLIWARAGLCACSATTQRLEPLKR